MERSLEIARDPQTVAETYGELAFQTAIRSGMWRRRPEHGVVEEWVDRALERAEPGSVPHVKALLARAFWSRVGADRDAREASALAEKMDDLDLRSFAWGARSATAFAEGHFDEALTWAQRRLDIVHEVSDPDHVSDIYDYMIASATALGRMREARRLALENKTLVANLSAHHRVHGVSNLIEVDELAGAWDNIRALLPEIEEAVGANLDTPCIRNARSLLTSAVAAEISGDADEADRLERRAYEVATEGYEPILSAPRAMLLLARGRFDELAGAVPPFREWRGQTWFSLAAATTRLDMLVALGDGEGVEREAPPLLRMRTYLQPFALRALGIVRQDKELLRRAVEVFESMGIDWHAQRTRMLV
jgi:tetratricopeptide (TPR) repeat protein